MKVSVIGCGYLGAVHAAAAGAQVHFLCVGVGAPQSKTSDGADLTFLVAATEALLPHLASGTAVVGKSAAPVGTLPGWTSVEPAGLSGMRK